MTITSLTFRGGGEGYKGPLNPTLSQTSLVSPSQERWGGGWLGWGRAGGPNEEPWVRTALPADVAHPVVAGPLRQWSDIVPRGVTVKGQ